MKTNPLSLAASSTKPRSIYERIVHYFLKEAKIGGLVMNLPNQRGCFEFGDNSEPIVMHIKNERFFRRCVLSGEIGFGESFVDGDWETEDLRGVLNWFTNNSETSPTLSQSKNKGLLFRILGTMERMRHATRKNTKPGSRKNIHEHYDLSNDFFSLMLDSSMAYSSGIYRNNEDSLAEAQINKFKMIFEKLQLSPDDHLLEIGSGWGGFAVYAAERSGCRVTSVTISEEQFSYASRLIEERGLSDRVSIVLQDYRDIEGQYDKIVSIEMVEALGHEYLDVYFSKCASLLAPHGIMVLQAITFPDPHYERYLRSIDFTQKHIFPGSSLLSLRETLNSLQRTGDLMAWDVESIGIHYARTLYDWRMNVERNREKVLSLGFSETFLRKWIYYLTFCEVGFANRYINDLQIVLSRPLNPNLFSNDVYPIYQEPKQQGKHSSKIESLEGSK